MRAVVKQIHKGKVATTIVKTFTDVPALFEFLQSQGVYITFREAAEDLLRDEVTYSMPLLNVEASDEYN